MQYLMSPLPVHYDYGFGATAEAFYRAALSLRKTDDDEVLFLGRLPRAFLLRHAVELFLKSSIVIIHRKLKLPSIKQSPTDFPSIPVGKHHKAFHNVHSIAPLYAYWKEIFINNSDALQRKASHPLDFSIPQELDAAVAVIEASDPTSTRYRYPANLVPGEDKEKSAFKEVPADELFPIDKAQGPSKKTFALVIQDEEGNFVRAYKYDDDAEKNTLDALVCAAGIFSDIHAMMRIAVTGGK